MPNGGKMEIIEFSRDEKFVVIDISDSGLGVPEVLKDRIFEPFFTLKKNHLGVGLTRARRIIERLGGEVYYVSKKERKKTGAVFRLKLPLYIG
ncbi:MAG: ATP-binding protein, partial [bacterium]|nr:ATP-binding protein [bacterium]